MGDKRYAVSISFGATSTTYTDGYQTLADHALKWKGVLEKAHSKAVINCLCDGNGDKRLAVRHMSESDSFHLSRFPHTGSQHALNCLYYCADRSKSGLGAYSKGVVEELSDGGLKVKLGLSLRKQDAAQPKEPKAASSTGPRVSKPSMSLLGLLNLLWSEAGLHSWSPAMTGKRNLGLVHHYLVDQAGKIQVGRQRLIDSLVIATSSSTGKQPDANAQRVKSAIERNRRLVVIAPLAAHSQEREGGIGYLAISGFHGVPRLIMSADLWSNAKRQFPRAISAWRQGLKIIAIVQADKPMSAASASTLSIALMPVSEEWIPVESSYEALIEKKLRTEGRRFNKPLRFDAAEQLVFPDFWLVDVNTAEYPLEVFGRADSAYVARKQEKITHYEQEYGPDGWWSWNAAADPHALAIPDFPASTRR